MEFDKKTIFAFVLIGLILVLVNTDFYQRFVYGDLPKTSSVPISKSPADKTQREVDAAAERASFPQTSSAQDLAAGMDSLVVETVPASMLTPSELEPAPATPVRVSEPEFVLITAAA